VYKEEQVKELFIGAAGKLKSEEGAVYRRHVERVLRVVLEF
jgi:hypothetical protein